MKAIFVTTILIVFGMLFWFSNNRKKAQQEQNTITDMKLKISFGDTELTATLYDNPTSRDLISMLPITTELKDYASNEKIFYPERKLTKDGAPGGYDPSKGDITYYAPWGDVAIFYKDFSYSSGLIGLGRIENNGIEKLRLVGSQPVTFELIEE
ncbi:cyclophilin-like fold protein [Allomuricauda sp. NBRC 101325]|uniref:cyclophilin-like fold protein n=1 Tax=Allomuricauda sp. NBRC 101325 TaxID=1113758 RepID=UPI0025574567|nr:cyclophilin-like fold protein [Muricauda sp. NBRC 101325]